MNAKQSTSRRISAVIGAVLLAAASAGASGANERAPLDFPALMRALAKIPALNADFSELRQTSYLATPLTLRGHLRYVAPARLEKHTLTPVEEHFVADGDRITVERNRRGNRERRQIDLNDYPQLRPYIDGLRATLAGDAARVERYYVPALSGTWGAWRLRLLPREATLRERIESVEIAGHEAVVTAVDVREANGDVSRMRVTPR